MKHQTHPEQAEPVRSEAVHAFGGMGGGLLDELVRQFGPILAQVILRWLMARQQAGEIPQHALLGMDQLRRFVAAELRSHRQAILDQAAAQTARLFDAGVAALEA